jgi:predicted DNA binding CopG/RHH family protein
MKTPSKRTRKQQSKDAQIEEFETRDLGADIRASGVRPIVLRPKGQPTSILLEPELVKQLREKGSKRGLGYQTMLKLIVREHLHEY